MAHDWFIISLSKQAHDKYHANQTAFEAKYGTHDELLKAFWKSIGFEPGAYMVVGMEPKREAWLIRVLGRLFPGFTP